MSNVPASIVGVVVRGAQGHGRFGLGPASDISVEHVGGRSVFREHFSSVLPFSLLGEVRSPFFSICRHLWSAPFVS